MLEYGVKFEVKKIDEYYTVQGDAEICLVYFNLHLLI
jgi:hypothetical protein